MRSQIPDVEMLGDEYPEHPALSSGDASPIGLRKFVMTVPVVFVALAAIGL